MSAELIERAVAMGATNVPGRSHLHGEQHWKCVAIMGFWLARNGGVPTSLSFLTTFAQMHDIMRDNDDEDPDHGLRASSLFMQMVIHPGIAEYPPYDPLTEDMIYALARHAGTAHARTHTNYMVGLCWDADRLLLRRVGIDPVDRYLSTEIARTDDAKLFGLSLVRMQWSSPYVDKFPTWDQIREEFEAWRFP